MASNPFSDFNQSDRQSLYNLFEEQKKTKLAAFAASHLANQRQNTLTLANLNAILREMNALNKTPHLIQRLKKKSQSAYLALQSALFEQASKHLFAYDNISFSMSSSSELFDDSDSESLKQVAVEARVDVQKVENENLSIAKRFLYLIVLIFGALNAGMAGYNGVAEITTLFTSSYWAMAIVGAVFGLISFFIFYGFDFQFICQAFGLKRSMTELRDKITTYHHQLAQYQQFSKKLIELIPTEVLTDDEVSEYRILLKRWCCNLQEKQIQLNQHHRGVLHNVLRFSMYALAGTLFFSYGFFSGTHCMLSLFDIQTTLSALLYTQPLLYVGIIAVGVMCGIATLVGFWWMERVGIRNALDKLFGLARDLLDEFMTADVLAPLKKVKQAVKQHRKTREIILNRAFDLSPQYESANDSVIHYGSPINGFTHHRPRGLPPLKELQCADSAGGLDAVIDRLNLSPRAV